MRTIFIAGIGNSEDEHWQRHWHRHLADSIWLEHADWDRPECDQWVRDLDDLLVSVPGPKFLVAHSLGCLVAVAWAQRHRDDSVVSAFLVAVPDPDGPTFPVEATGFAPILRQPLPLPATMIVSDDDPYSTPAYSRAVAEAWQTRAIEIGHRGHINLTSGLGFWQEGWDHFERHHKQSAQGA
ncbi:MULTISPECIES: RBBP9/YdeN family alpha/beta hydrolase [Rhizobium]|uniref:Alpha/beta hydrolase n=1 Tax=Rhizobium favelukesii TaxID=348824 RepID=W6RM44_9HYPH|nr:MULTISPECIES: alpha/beta hydrolase [Rhizobium]MCS0463457.1 alpha/beta hydrolase [Rhizobium favelukesii]UFS85081.1 alpha/beta hydrolase [Rhizobium sp. T136]CDM60013.1 hypothetical protein LPU83_pLPU83b_0013 [Rhizobium favelukesii]